MRIIAYPWWRGRPTMEAVLMSALGSFKAEGDVSGTHGKRLWAHRHRRNRPCTYPNWHSKSVHVQHPSFRHLPARIAVAAKSWYDVVASHQLAGSGGQVAFLPIVNDQGGDLLCKANSSQPCVLQPPMCGGDGDWSHRVGDNSMGARLTLHGGGCECGVG